MFPETETQVELQAIDAADEMARCAICKYDLRCAPHGVCPECGASHAERARKLDERKTLKGVLTTVVIVVALGPIVIPMLIMLLGLVVAIVASAGSFIEDGSRYRYSDLKAELSRVPGVQLVGMHSTGGPSDPLGGSVIVDDRWQAFVEVPAGFNLNHNKSVAIRWGAKERTWTSNEAFTVLDLSRPNELDSVAGVPVRSVSDVVANLKTIVPWAERKRRVEPQTGRPRAVVIEVDAIRGRSTTDTPPRR